MPYDWDSNCTGAFIHMLGLDGLRWARYIVVGGDGSWDGMGCAGNSMYFSEGIHTLSYQRIPSQLPSPPTTIYLPISAHPVPACV